MTVIGAFQSLRARVRLGIALTLAGITCPAGVGSAADPAGTTNAVLSFVDAAGGHVSVNRHWPWNPEVKVMTALAGWENFYVIVGSSAGGLIGLQFVEMTLIADVPVGAIAAEAAPITYVGSVGFNSNIVSGIDTASNTVVATVPVGREPVGVAITPF